MNSHDIRTMAALLAQETRKAERHELVDSLVLNTITAMLDSQSTIDEARSALSKAQQEQRDASESLQRLMGYEAIPATNNGKSTRKHTYREEQADTDNVRQ